MKYSFILVSIFFVPISLWSQPCTKLKGSLLRKLAKMQTIVNPCTLNAVSLDYGKSSALFFAAHPDDETLGMSGMIANYKNNNNQVIVEMLTDGRVSNAHGKINSRLNQENYSLFGKHDHSKDQGITQLEFGEGRFREFIDSMRRLKVDAIVLNDYPVMYLSKQHVHERLNFWSENSLNITYLYGTAGYDHDFAQHSDHEEIYQAIKESTVTADENKYWALIYAYRNNDRKNILPKKYQRILDPALCNKKKLSLKAYGVWAPEQQRYAIGWNHSTPDLFDAAISDCTEYILNGQTEPFIWQAPTKKIFSLK